ncbi:MAG: ATP-binding cassette domain-containing protein [Buchnera aphidicola (Kaburagia rhusicola rhusicola)]
MSLVYVQNATFLLNQVKLLNDVSFQIKEKERICLVGNNGTGKSTFLNIIAKIETLDNGIITYKKNIKIKYLEQNIVYNSNKSIYEFICEGITHESQYLKDYFRILHHSKFMTFLNNSQKLIQLKKIFDTKKLWDKKKKIDDIINYFGLNSHAMLSSLSGGLLRKIELGKILVSEPDLIILDEPTNHLDIITIHWLEKFLTTHLISVLFVSHDRSFINKVSTRIIHLNSGSLISWTGDYDSFLNNQSNNRYINAVKKIKFEKKLDKEKLWANSGVKARSTKNESRMKQLQKMINESKLSKPIMKTTKIVINEDNYSGRLFFKLKEVCFNSNQMILINSFSDIVQRGEKIALIGINGSGKSTLLKLIVGELKPNSGSIDFNPNVKTAYFDQKRVKINLDKTILDNLSHEKNEITINNKKYHKLKYLEQFSFPKEKIKLKARVLSGGEINKLLLAKLFLKKSNVLILDEPTNDLDLESLQNLEIALKKYKGVILLVSHDQKFIQQVANKYWCFKKNGHIDKHLIFPDIKKWNNIIPEVQNLTSLQKTTNTILTKNKLISKISKKDLKKELKNMPKKIEKIENCINQLQNEINSSNFFYLSLENKKELLNQLKNAEINLEKHFLRWEYLELKNNL